MTQFSLKVGLNEFGYNMHSAAKSEIKSLHLRKTFIPMHRHDLTYEELQMVLESYMFLNKKRYIKIKVRTVAGGKTQRTYIPKEDTSSPTARKNSVLLTSIIDAKESRDVSGIDTPNVFIQTRVKKRTWISSSYGESWCIFIA